MGDDVSPVVAALQHSLLPEQQARLSAEQALRDLELSGGPYLVLLFRVVVDTGLDIDGAVRQAGAIALKNLVARRWEAGTREAPLPEAEKAIVRQNLLEGLIHASAPVRVQLGLVFKSACYVDFPHAWSGLLDELLRNLQAGEQRTYGALYAQRMLVKKYEYKSGADREPLRLIVRRTFGPLLCVFGALAQSEGAAAYDAVRLLCKIFWSTIQSSLPEELSRPWEGGQLSAWMAQIVALLERPVPPALQPADADGVGENPAWKAKKWAAHILHRMLQRYGNPRYARDEGQKQLAHFLLAQYAPRCLGAALALLSHKSAGAPCSPRVETLCLNFVGEAIGHASLYRAVRPQLEGLLVRIVFPQLCFSQAELELWREEPAEFVRKELDVLEEFYSPKVAAANLLTDLVRKKPKDTLHPFLDFCAQLLAQAAAAVPGGPGSAALPADFGALSRKDGVLLALAELAPVLRKKVGDEHFATLLEPMVKAHVAPELRSSVGFMRARACAVYARLYRSMQFRDEAHFAESAAALLGCLRDAELPVRVHAAMALQHLLNKEQAAAMLRPRVAELCELLFSLMNDIGHEEVVSALDALIGRFAAEMCPHAVSVVSSLVGLFGRMLDEGDEDEDSMLAAMSVMRTLSTLLEAVSSSPEAFPPLQALLLPLLARLIASPDCSDFLEDALAVLGYLTFYAPTLPAEALALLPPLSAAFCSHAVEFGNQMLVPLDNILARATDAFLAAADERGVPYVSLVLAMPLRVLGCGPDGGPLPDGGGGGGARERLLLPECECHGPVRLLQSLLHNCAGRIDGCLPVIIRMCLHGLRSAETVALRTLLLDGLASGLHYSAPLCLACLEAEGATAQLLAGWTEHVAEHGGRLRAHECKVMTLGLAALFAGPPAALPAGAQASLVGCVRAAATLAARAAALREEARRREASERSGSGSDEELDDDDESEEDEEEAAGEGRAGGGGASAGGGEGEDADADGSGRQLSTRPLDVSRALRAGALTGEELSRLVSEFGDEDDELDDEDELYASPLDAIDEGAAFVAALEGACAQEPRLRQLLGAELSAHEQQQLRALAEHAALGRREAAVAAGAGGGAGAAP